VSLRRALPRDLAKSFVSRIPDSHPHGICGWRAALKDSDHGKPKNVSCRLEVSASWPARRTFLRSKISRREPVRPLVARNRGSFFWVDQAQSPCA
jgi:hypothetical protein